MEVRWKQEPYAERYTRGAFYLISCTPECGNSVCSYRFNAQWQRKNFLPLCQIFQYRETNSNECNGAGIFVKFRRRECRKVGIGRASQGSKEFHGKVFREKEDEREWDGRLFERETVLSGSYLRGLQKSSIEPRRTEEGCKSQKESERFLHYWAFKEKLKIFASSIWSSSRIQSFLSRWRIVASRYL